MKKQRLFRIIDLVVMFNVFVFIGSGFLALSQKSLLPSSILLFAFALLNILYLINAVIFRKKYNADILKKIEAELEAEENLNFEEKEKFREIKQNVLESLVDAEVKIKFPGAKVIRNVYIPKYNGGFSEIDHIVLCELGIFIIESKNISGTVTGSWADDYLMVEPPGGSPYSMYNPINQNTMHYKYLKSALGLDSTLFRSLIVFGDSAFIQSYQGVPRYARICKLDTLTKNMNWLANDSPKRLESHRIDSIYELLLQYVTPDEEIQQQHIESVSIIKDSMKQVD